MRKDYRHLMAQVALTDQKKEEILTMLEQNNNQTSKRRAPAVTKIVLAAALAVGCVLSIAAGLPAQVYNFMSGGSVSITDHGNTTTVDSFAWDLNGEQAAPIVLEDGKLWFVNGDERTDLTGLVDENTPYIYGACSMQGQNYADSYLTIDGVRQPSYEMSEELVEKLNHDPSYELSSVNHPWLDAALDQLSLDI